MTDAQTPSAWAYEVASRLIAEVAACGCETVPLDQYALCGRCECLVRLARVLRDMARETHDA